MKKIICIVLFYFAPVYLVLAQPAHLNGKIKFAWGDEFNGTAINTELWNVVNNFDNYGDGHGSVAVARNVSVKDGFLNCKAVKENYRCPGNDSWNCVWQQQQGSGSYYTYTYGRIDSKEKYNQQYGYAEASMLFPHERGLWPSFWTFIGDGLGSAHMNGGEIDIMERMEDSDAKTVTTNVHLNHCNGASESCPNGVGAYCPTAPDCYGLKHTLSKEFWHSTKYAVYWNPTELTFYINDMMVRQMPNPGVVDPLKFILGLGVQADKAFNDNAFPATLYVDYIRVYSLQECLSTVIVPIGETRNNNHGFPDIMLACARVDGNGTNGGSLMLVAKNSVALLPNFEVKAGGYLEARISNTGREQTTTEELPASEKVYHPIHMRSYSNNIVAPEKVTREGISEDMFTISPNPVLNTASINYSIATQAAVKITLYNIMGIAQEELVNENQQAGDHTYELNGLNYKAGIYVLVFESGGVTQKKTIVITR